jgi:hypothetical protein
VLRSRRGDQLISKKVSINYGALVKTVTNIHVPLKAVKFLSKQPTEIYRTIILPAV